MDSSGPLRLFFWMKKMGLPSSKGVEPRRKSILHGVVESTQRGAERVAVEYCRKTLVPPPPHRIVPSPPPPPPLFAFPISPSRHPLGKGFESCLGGRQSDSHGKVMGKKRRTETMRKKNSKNDMILLHLASSKETSHKKGGASLPSNVPIFFDAKKCG